MQATMTKLLLGILGLLLVATRPLTTVAVEGARVVSFYGYEDCILLENETTEVVLCPAAGGRILKYATRGKNILYLPEGDEGWVWDGVANTGPMNAGRCDIGPEQLVPKRQELWLGRWQGEITGDREAKLTSPDSPATGVFLIRSFKLDANSSRLQFTQTIISNSATPLEYCHWSRTFAEGKGICIIPLSKPSRFLESYVRYDPPGRMLNMQPSDAKIERIDDFLVISDHPQNPKLGFDSMAGWLAYYSHQNLLFVKKFPTYPDRVYNEVASLTISVWFPNDAMVELEPIGPRERFEKPGQRASFTETWYLLDYPFPASQVDPKAVSKLVSSLE